MGTLKGSPTPPAMVRARQSRAAPHATWPRLACLVICVIAVGCGGADPPPADAGPPPVIPDAGPPTPQRPPAGDQAALEAWLGEGHYLGWNCETMIFPPRPPTGGHGRQKICSNTGLLASTSGPYPVGAASVKLLYGPADEPNGFAVALKVMEGEGAFTWYWYERRGTNPGARPLAQGLGVPDCAVCHQQAPRDYVFLRAP
jgi:hypothetical protein